MSIQFLDRITTDYILHQYKANFCHSFPSTPPTPQTPTQTFPSKTLLNFLTGTGDPTTASSCSSSQNVSSAKLSGDIPPRKGGEYGYDVNEKGDGENTGDKTGDSGNRAAGARVLILRDCLRLAEIKLGIL